MQTRSFEAWLATFRDSINSYKYYVDFEKVYAHVEKFKIEINILNSLINSRNVEAEIFCMDETGAVSYSFDVPNQTVAQYKYFMRETGLFELLEKHLISNLYDYLTGVEVGLDSNGRKNRGRRRVQC